MCVRPVIGTVADVRKQNEKGAPGARKSPRPPWLNRRRAMNSLTRAGRGLFAHMTRPPLYRNDAFTTPRAHCLTQRTRSPPIAKTNLFP